MQFNYFSLLHEWKPFFIWLDIKLKVIQTLKLFLPYNNWSSCDVEDVSSAKHFPHCIPEWLVFDVEGGGYQSPDQTGQAEEHKLNNKAVWVGDQVLWLQTGDKDHKEGGGGKGRYVEEIQEEGRQGKLLHL